MACVTVVDAVRHGLSSIGTDGIEPAAECGATNNGISDCENCQHCRAVNALRCECIDGQYPSSSDIDLATWEAATLCRSIVESCLLEEEWRDADKEFFNVIQSALQYHKTSGVAAV